MTARSFGEIGIIRERMPPLRIEPLSDNTNSDITNESRKRNHSVRTQRLAALLAARGPTGASAALLPGSAPLPGAAHPTDPEEIEGWLEQQRRGDGDAQQIAMPENGAEAFRTMIHYAHSGVAVFEPGTVMEVLQLADYLALEELKAHRRARRAVRKLRRWEAARDIVPVAPDREPDGTSSVYRPPVPARGGRSRVNLNGEEPVRRRVQGSGPGFDRRQVPFRPAGVAGLELSRGLSTAIGQARLALADAERELTEAHERRVSARRQRESVARLYRGGHARTSVARKEPAPPWAQRRP